MRGILEKSEIRKEVLDRLKSLPNFDKLKFIYLFGSKARSKSHQRSDIDICLYYDLDDEEELYRLLLRISGSFPEKFDVEMFQFLPLYVKRDVFKGELLYTKDKDFVYDLARETYREYEDFEPRYRYILYGKAGMEASI